MGHDHAAAAVALQSKAVHGIPKELSAPSHTAVSDVSFIPFLHALILDHSQVALPEIARHLVSS